LQRFTVPLEGVVLAFKIELDSEHVALAGFEDWSVLGMHVSAGRSRINPEEIELSVGGLSRADTSGVAFHFRWPGRRLQVGSTVTVSVVDTEHPDPPAKRYRSDKEVQESPFTDAEWKEMRRQDYLELKKEFGDGSG